jgi:outer membrane protein TolC
LKQLQDDPQVDMVLALGYVSSQLASLFKEHRKPTFAPFVMDANLLRLPRKGNGSGIKNLNYLSGEADFVLDLQAFRNVVDFSNVAVFIDKSSFDAFPGLIERAKQVAAAGGVTIQFVQQITPDEDLTAKLPTDVEAAVITSLPRLSREGMDQLIGNLIKRRLPSYSLPGSHLVEQGLLMSESPASDWKRLARRNALNMLAVLQNENAGNQPVSFKGRRRLTINMATARAIGLSPRFDVLSEAVLLNEEPEPKGRQLSLSVVASEAVAANLDLRAASFGLDAGQTDVDEARAKLLPQVQVGMGYNQTNDDSLAVISGSAAEKSTTSTVSVTQLIYSEKVNADVEIKRYLQENLQVLYRQLELDIVQDATTAYLEVLKAQTFVRIRRENLNVIRSNLELARERRRIGVASPAEVYRWESELATGRQELLAARTRLQQTRDGLNRLLHRPLKEPFITEPATLDDPSLLISRKEMFDLVKNERTFGLLGDFLEKEGLAVSPELASLKALTAVEKRELISSRRAYWSPDVVLQGEVFNVLDEDRVGDLSAEGDTNWQVSLRASIPIFEGGAKRARLAGSMLAMEQRRTQLEAVREVIQQRIRANMHRIRASYPTIRLSKQATAAARKNLDLVTDSYSRGAVSIIDLLDAKNAALVAEQSAANAVFDFLIDLMNLQRSAGRFDFFLDNRDRDNWFKRLKMFVD